MSKKNDFSYEGLPIVTSDEMKRIETLAYKAGASEETFMENAGISIAEQSENFVSTHHLSTEAIVIAGKGNNAGDAFVAARKLLAKGFKISCYHLYDIKECSSLCQKMALKFQQAGGKIQKISSEDEIVFSPSAFILDGIVGTGFKGKAEGLMAKVIEKANKAKLPILAIDIPSGLNGTTGEVGSVAFLSTQTLYLELPKIGFFLEKGWDHVGELVRLSFGLDSKRKAEAKAVSYLMQDENLSLALPPIKRTRYKYERGYVLAIAGGFGMAGAAIMACLAALRSGAGIVRWFYPQGIENEIQRAPLELIKEGWDLKDDEKIFIESKRAKAFIIGPGIGRSEQTKKVLSNLLKKIELPCVIDADALYFIAENPKWQLPKNAVLTPHKQEMQRLLSNQTPDMDSCQEFVENKKVTLLLKGAPTMVFHPNSIPITITHGDPGMATAGSGDVLTGVIAALLAQGLSPKEAACLGATLHGLAGECAAQYLTSYSVMASDLIQFLPDVFAMILHQD